jgi:hypothetical protein
MYDSEHPRQWQNPIIDAVKAVEINNGSIPLSFDPASALHQELHIPICAA